MDNHRKQKSAELQSALEQATSEARKLVEQLSADLEEQAAQRRISLAEALKPTAAKDREGRTQRPARRARSTKRAR